MEIENSFSLNIPQSEILRSTAKYNLMLCGVGTGKSYLAGWLAYRYIKIFPKVKGFIGANYYSQLDKATLERVKEVWASAGIREYSKSNPSGVYVSNCQPPSHFITERHNIDRYEGTIAFINGGLIFTGSMDNAKAHEGKQFGWLILDETKDTKEEDVKDVMIPRVRQMGMYLDNDGNLTDKPNEKSYNPIYFLTTPAKVEWLNKLFNLEDYISEIESKIYNPDDVFVKRDGVKFVVIASTHHNAENLPANYISDFMEANSEERIKALIWGNPFSTSGGEFYSSFSRLQNVKEFRYNPKLPIHVSFDQNTVPYNSCLISQLEKTGERWQLRSIDEITLKNPNNSTEEVCNELLRRYGDCETIFYYGDASGKARSTLSKNERHHYEVIQRVLARKLNNGSNRVSRRNPPLIARREFANKIFEGKLPIDFYVSSKCTELIKDFTYLKQDIDGGKKKEVTTDKETGERYQKYGHLSDCFDYKITSMFSNYFSA